MILSFRNIVHFNFYFLFCTFPLRNRFSREYFFDFFLILSGVFFRWLVGASNGRVNWSKKDELQLELDLQEV